MVTTMTTTYMMLILVTTTTTSPDQDDDADYYDRDDDDDDADQEGPPDDDDDDDDDVDDQEGPPRPPASYKPCWPSLRGPQGGKTFLQIEIFISVTNICYGYFMQLVLSQHFELKQYKQKHFTIASFTGMATYDSDDDDDSDGDDYADNDYGYNVMNDDDYNPTS